MDSHTVPSDIRRIHLALKSGTLNVNGGYSPADQ
jgi:hypothetical protein